VNTAVPAVVLQVVPEPFHHGALGVVRTLGRLGVPVFLMHGERHAPSGASRFCRGTFVCNGAGGAEGDVVAFLREVGERLGDRPVLIPIDDPGTMIVDEHADTLAERFRFPRQPPGLVRALANKRELNRLARDHAIPTPEAVAAPDEDELARILDRSAFPVVLKSAESIVPATLSRAPLLIAGSREDALRAYRGMTPAERANVLVQEYIPGGPESVWMFNGYFDERSSCLVGFTGRKLRQSPPYTGATSLGVCIPNEEVAETTTRLMKELSYRGVLDIGYRYDARDGAYKLLDANPRVGSTFRLFVDPASGMDVVRALYLDLTGQAVEPVSQPNARKWIVEPWDVRSSIQYVRDGRLTPREWLASLRGVSEAAWFAKDDLRPFGLMSLRLLTNTVRKTAHRPSRARA
jgi:predicted ATP-grasp superfamily ATP-dependent carboligase